MIDKRADWVALNMVRGIGPRLANQLLREFGSPANVFSASRKALEKQGLKLETILELHAGEVLARAGAEIERLEPLGIELVTLDDPRYPSLLREIHDPPLVLYARGEWLEAAARPCLAVVGSRRSSSYGVNAALSLARELAASGLTIVSGLARGIDAAAHRGALEAVGKTIAVVGTGLDTTYPAEHRKLGEEIINSGAIVSEFPLGTPPLPQNFPYRNRVLSGLSFGVLIIEAAEHSGSLITARLAAEQGRDVYAVPGNITSQTSFGPNYLIKDGAKLIQCGRDVLEELPPSIRDQISGATPPLTHTTTSLTTPGQTPIEVANLSAAERTVLELLSPDVPSHIDQLLIASRLSSPEMMNALLGLEMKDRITQLPGKSFLRRL
ncbi:MAG: DNA-protecting protein DprA [Acidobacteria bacterium]|nr:DNA-protecting protein DprA [Acidobacteriota bacterium]